MIFFDNIVAKTFETIKDAHDCADILNDLNQIEQAKAGFDRQRQLFEEKEKEVGDALEHAFDFMEHAFGDSHVSADSQTPGSGRTSRGGQEMVIFVTELTLSPEAAVFLAEHTCERYLEYNQELLIGTRRRDLLNEINHS